MNTAGVTALTIMIHQFKRRHRKALCRMPSSDLVSATDLAGGSWQYQYDSAPRLTRVLDPLGNTTERTEYDSEGRAVRQYDGLDNLILELTYNSDGTTTITDVFENSETHIYDDRHTLTGDTDVLGGTTNKTYDYNFRPATITDAGGDTMSTPNTRTTQTATA